MSVSVSRSVSYQKCISPDGVFLSPATRQQSINVSATPVLEDFPRNDDEQERKQRRRSRVADLQLSNTESPSVTEFPSNRQAETLSNLVPKLNNIQIADHYSTCIKLSTENKITTKNAFGLHLIDYMTEILKQKDSELTNFKVAAGTLDASTKIYAVRVDAVHADVYRVLGGLGKDSQPAASELQDSKDPDSSGDPENTKKVKKKQKCSYKTIEQNLNNINRSENNSKSEIDPMFQKTAAAFDESRTVGVFLSTMHCNDYYNELLFDFDVIPLSSSKPKDPPTPVLLEVTDVKDALLKCAEKRPICPSLAGFHFTRWEINAHDDTASSLLNKFKQSSQVFDIHTEPENEEDGENTHFKDDFDADVFDEMEAGDLGDFREQREACRIQRENISRQVIPLGDADIGTMCLHLSEKPWEYSYFSPRAMSMWAGPEHWHFRHHQKKDDHSEKNIKTKKAKKIFELNFEEDIDFDIHFQETRVATTLSKITLDSQNKKSTTLPADFNYHPDNIIQLSLKPSNRLKKMAVQSELSQNDGGIREYDYSNPNDTSNYCPGLQAADSDDDDFQGTDGMFELTANPESECRQNVGSNIFNITTYGEDNLVDEPQKVNKIELHYAKTAKKMDMKRLKRSMWSLLTDEQEKQTENETEVLKNERVMDERAFSGITRQLLNRLPSVMAQNLSVPLAFACLLHLANEKNLKLKSVEDLSDIFISQGD
uniref:Condensin complex subunit 2 n=1 Tax=Geotrypetes seraphini TaxID=260995 RepID=A0A6P8RJG8_GEOSA|nr:condensin complex subunit 2 [Geotrypetes seraphini]XP_033803512.1 condensin complex subunit 2 [Geotrypetes seraphini]